MNNNNKIFRAILCVAIIVAFFLPWFKSGEGSGLDLIITNSNNEQDTATTIVRYSFLLIPFFALIVLIRSINKKSANFLLRLLPFLVTAILTALFILGVNLNGGTGEELNSWLQKLDYGFYISVLSSLVLIFV